MSWVKTKKKEPINLDEFKDLDEDSILQTLTEDEIKELDEAIDPEVSFCQKIVRVKLAASVLFWFEIARCVPQAFCII